jgi:hypothetical protein
MAGRWAGLSSMADSGSPLSFHLLNACYLLSYLYHYLISLLW